MSWLSRITFHVKSLFLKKKLEAQLTEEVRTHVDMATEANVAAGMPPEEARYAALREFGNVAGVQERTRDEHGWVWLAQLGKDLRYALRQLRKTPGFTLVTVLSLALGIGANTAIFSALDRTLLRPLPVKNADELIRLQWLSGPKGGRPETTEDEMDRTDPATGRRTGTIFSRATFEAFHGHHPMLANVFAFARPPGFTLEIDGQVEGAGGQVVSGEYHTGLGAVALHGRTILPEDDRPGATPVAVISHLCWQRRFGGDLAAIGKTIFVNRTPVTVVGVMAPDFVDPISVFGQQQFSFPLAMLPQLDPGAASKARQGYWWLRIMGRLRPGVSFEQAAASLQVSLQSSTREGLTEKDDPPLLRASPGGHGLVESRRATANPLLVLMGMVVLVLLAACANVANLLLARGAARQREIAVRLALGASRGRLIRQLLTESVLLALLGSAFGLILASWGGALPYLGTPGARVVDFRVFGFASAVALATGVAFGLVPALRATRLDLTAEFQGGSRQLGRGGRSRLSQTLLVVQVALSLVLLVGAGLFVRTLRNLQAIDIGFTRSRLLLFSLDAATAGYKLAQFSDLHGRIAERIGALPGVRSVAFSSTPVLGGMDGLYYHFSISGRTLPRDQGNAAALNQVGAGFFETFEMPAVVGRTLLPRDDAPAPQVVVVNQALAAKYFPGENPVGRRIRLNGEKEIVGVVRDVKQISLRAPTPPTAFMPFSQQAVGAANFAVRTVGEPNGMIASVRKAVSEVERNLPLVRVRTQERQIDDYVGQERVFAQLSGFFGVLALSLACVGLYGLMSYAVLRRTGEIGLRMALGALPGNVMRMILRESLALVALGVVVGIAGACAATRLVAAMLYDLSPTDPLTYGVVALVLVAVGVLACWLPARWAAKVDPVVALRAE